MQYLIELSKGFKVLVDPEDYEYLNQFKWYFGSGYARRDLRGNGKKTILSMHRVITKCPDNLDVDHINGNKLDNRKINLRFCTPSQNIANSKKSKANKSGYKGVFWAGWIKKWRVQIVVNRKNIHIGVFNDKIEAAKAYDIAALKYFGEFANLNFKGEN